MGISDSTIIHPPLYKHSLPHLSPSVSSPFVLQFLVLLSAQANNSKPKPSLLERQRRNQNRSTHGPKPIYPSRTFIKSHKSQSFKSARRRGRRRGSCDRARMCLVCGCEEEEREIGRQQASGSCPYCGGKVQAVDVESHWRFCFLPLCFTVKRKYYCSLCSRRLVLYQ